jgi:N4-gp56 family major capsid protein
VSLNQFIPTIWSARMFEALRKTLVYSQEGLINRDYEGEFAEAGDTVNVHTIGDPTIVDYVKNTDMPVPETLTDTRKTMQITQAKAFHFQVDDIDQAQQKPKVMDMAMSRSAYRFADIADQYIASIMLAGAATANAIGTDALPIVAPTAVQGASSAYEVLVDLSVKMNEANVPSAGRWVVVPPWFEGTLRKDARFINNESASQMPGEPLLNGQIGRAAGFTVLMSNNVPTVAAPGGAANTQPRYKIIGGHQIATTFADTISKVEAYRPEKRFGDAVKGLHVYGSGVFEPAALAVLTVTRS